MSSAGRPEQSPAAGSVRVDAYDKVKGAVRYAADRVPPGLKHGVLAVAPIAKGTITRIETAAAEAVPGVRLVLTRPHDGELSADAGFLLGGGYGVQSLQPLTDDHIAYRGQPIALVVADTLEIATEAAALVSAEYQTDPPALTLDSEGTETLLQSEAVPLPMFADLDIGQADAAFADSTFQVDNVYDQPPQHPNPMELIGTVAEWRGDTLVIHEGSQNTGAIRFGLAKQLSVDPGRIEVRSPYLGGGFGQKNSLQPHTALTAIAARRLDCPVKVVVSRSQLFHDGSFRPQTRHRVRLGADQQGRLRSAIYEVDQQTSRHDLFPGSYTEAVARLYGIPNFRSRTRLVRADSQTPGYMRAPYEQSAVFAFESAMDELSYRAGLDPLAIRLANDTGTDPVTGNPFSSRQLAECLRLGARRFGWSNRSGAPMSMTDADGTQIGWGVAAGAYKGSSAPAIARLTAEIGGRVTIEVSGHEMGQGIRTAVVATVTSDLGVPASDVTCILGDTRSVPQHLAAGSWGTAAAIPAVTSALTRLRAELRCPPTGPPELARALTESGRASVTVEASHLSPGMPGTALDQMRQGLVMPGGPEYPDFTAMSWVAHFVEVRIEPTTRRVRVSRVVSTVDCGTVVSPTTARSQVQGAVVWGIGAALRERSIVEPGYGGFLNDDLAEYVIPVNADIGEIDVHLLDIPDGQMNGPGVKGVGEISMVAVAPAIANAVYHATGRRVRHVPIVLEDLL